MQFIKKYDKYLLIILILLFAGLVLQRAWLYDDAYITFRVVDNAVNGYKFTWNTDEKVQVYTHPLWFLLVTAVQFVFRDIYLVGIFLSLVIAVAAVSILAFKVSKTLAGGVLAVLVLTMSNAFVDFSTSGLENTLTHLLLVLFFWVFFAREGGVKKFFLLSLVSSFGIINRMDTALLFLPPLAAAWWQLGAKQRLKGLLWAAAGQIPFLLWEIFATLYYGFPFPNTAYAKINWLIPLNEVLSQAKWYFWMSLINDPVTLVSIGVVIAAVIWGRKRSLYPLAISILLYFVYIISLGGDFIAYRFFTAPLVIGVVILSRLDFSRLNVGWVLAAAGGIVALGLAAPVPVFMVQPAVMGEQLLYHTITDERLKYGPTTALFRDGHFNREVSDYWAELGKSVRKDDPDQVYEFPAVGYFGFYAGPQLHVVDAFGLGDALLARMPPYHRGREWRPGQFKRVIPDGYVKTIEGKYKQNLIADKNLAEYFDHLSVIIRGSTFSRERLQEIWKMNTGVYENLIDFDTYRYPESVTVKCSSMGCNPGGQPVQLGERGMLLVFDERIYPQEISIELVAEGNFDVELSRENKAVLWRSYALAAGDKGLITLKHLPASVRKQGIDRIFIFPFDKQPPYSLVKVEVRPAE